MASYPQRFPTQVAAIEKGFPSMRGEATVTDSASTAADPDWPVIVGYQVQEYLASAGKNQTVRLWDAVSGQEGANLVGLTQQVNAVGFSPDSSRLASCSVDETVKPWDLRTAVPMRPSQ